MLGWHTWHTFLLPCLHVMYVSCMSIFLLTYIFVSVHSLYAFAGHLQLAFTVVNFVGSVRWCQVIIIVSCIGFTWHLRTRHHYYLGSLISDDILA
jgi:hypothetical protein